MRLLIRDGTGGHVTQRPSILVVDDSDSLRMAVAQFLSSKGCRVTTAGNGVQGLKAIRRDPFDVVITDLEMPERGGLWLWERAVSIQPSLRGRFVFTTGEPSPDIRSMGVFIGGERFSIKPLSLTVLWAQVEAILQALGNRTTDSSSSVP